MKGQFNLYLHTDHFMFTYCLTIHTSERRIKKLTDYYRTAIIKNSTKSQDSVVHERAVAQMTKDILAVLHPSVQHSKPEKQHQYWPMDSWCGWHTDPATYKDVRHLPSHFMPHLSPLFDRLSKPPAETHAIIFFSSAVQVHRAT